MTINKFNVFLKLTPKAKKDTTSLDGNKKLPEKKGKRRLNKFKFGKRKRLDTSHLREICPLILTSEFNEV